MNRNVTFENNLLTLVGRRLDVSDAAPACSMTNTETDEVSLDSFGSRVKLVHFFTSLDTPVCDLQVREFDRRAGALRPPGQAVWGPGKPGSSPRPRADEPWGVAPVVIGVSMDLPFAHKRFSETFGIRHSVLLSDHRYASFGINYGLLIKEWNLLARGCLIIDRGNSIRYMQLVEEITNPPDFDEAFEMLAKVLEHPVPRNAGGTTKEPDSENSLPLSKDALGPMLERVSGWTLADGSRISKIYRFKGFAEAKQFLDIVSRLAEEHNHHPSFRLDYNRLEVTLSTHSAGGLTQNDFIIAKIIDQLS
jgi:thiol peroxidase